MQKKMEAASQGLEIMDTVSKEESKWTKTWKFGVHRDA